LIYFVSLCIVCVRHHLQNLESCRRSLIVFLLRRVLYPACLQSLHSIFARKSCDINLFNVA